jgi:hypothetical protein
LALLFWRSDPVNNKAADVYKSLGDLTPQQFADKFISVQGQKTILKRFLGGQE